ncbi:MAG TPA: IclR family transcriptional regulator [Jatrophihabitans sp.]|nr:IclR family transcriptional regulator [Jatrophihabitans sp.]
MPGSIQSVERAAAILQLVAEYPAQLGLTDITETLDLAKPTTHGLLKTLCEVGFVEQLAAGGKYTIGAGLNRLGQVRLDPNELRSHSVNWTDSLAARSGFAVLVAAFPLDQPGPPEIVHHVFRPDDSDQRLLTGRQIPEHATALGKILLAGSPMLAHRGSDALEVFTPATIASARVLARELVIVRKQGWAASIDEFCIGVTELAAPIRGAGGRVVAAIGLSGRTDRVTDAKAHPKSLLVRQVAETARAISRDLGTARR